MKKVGILGLAHGHVFSFGNEWVNRPELGVEIWGAWDRDEERLRSGAEKLKTRAYADIDALLGSGIDAVVITSETAYHADLVEKAAAAGKTLSQVAQELGWSAEVWDFSGDYPVHVGQPPLVVDQAGSNGQLGDFGENPFIQ